MEEECAERTMALEQPKKGKSCRKMLLKLVSWNWEEYMVGWKGACSREGELETEWLDQSCHRNHVEITAWAATGFY